MARVHGLTVDLPEVVELRRRLLPENPRLRSIGRSDQVIEIATRVEL